MQPLRWPVRLSVRTPGFHPGKRGSTPLRATNKSRDGAVVARRAHNPKVTGSSPVPATKKEKSPETVTFFILPQFKAIENKGILREKSFTFRS